MFPMDKVACLIVLLVRSLFRYMPESKHKHVGRGVSRSQSGDGKWGVQICIVLCQSECVALCTSFEM